MATTHHTSIVNVTVRADKEATSTASRNLIAACRSTGHMYCKRYMQEHHSAFLALSWLAPDPQIHLKIILDMDYKLAIAIYLGTTPNVW